MYLSLESFSPSPLVLFVHSFSGSDSFFPPSCSARLGLLAAPLVRDWSRPASNAKHSEARLRHGGGCPWSPSDQWASHSVEDGSRRTLEGESFHCGRQINSNDNDGRKVNERTLLSLMTASRGINVDLETL